MEKEHKNVLFKVVICGKYIVLSIKPYKIKISPCKLALSLFLLFSTIYDTKKSDMSF